MALKGTVGEPAINGVLDGTYGSVAFGTPAESLMAQVQGCPSCRIVFDKQFRYENIRLLASTMAHEPLHRDSTSSEKEELINDSIDCLAYGQFLLETPGVAPSGTELARSKNTDLMARLNTRDTNGKLRLFTSQGNNFPESDVFVPYYTVAYEPLGSNTPGNSVLKQMVRNVVGPNVTPPRTVNFNDNTLLLLDANQKVFTNAELVELAVILRLDTSPQAARDAQETDRKAPQKPVPDWREIYRAE